MRVKEVAGCVERQGTGAVGLSWLSGQRLRCPSNYTQFMETEVSLSYPKHSPAKCCSHLSQIIPVKDISF